MACQELSLNELDYISGGDGCDGSDSCGVSCSDGVTEASNWNEVFVGMGMIGLGLTIAATPVGWVGVATATILSYAGGILTGDGYAGSRGKMLRSIVLSNNESPCPSNQCCGE
jgi:hypothetical protein